MPSPPSHSGMGKVEKAIILLLALRHVADAISFPVAHIDVTGLPGGPPFGDFRPNFGYNNGPLIKSPVVTTLAWGTGVRNFPAVNSLLADLPKTKYIAWINKEYSVPKYALKGGHFRRELVINPAFKTTLKDKEIQKTIAQLVKQKALPENTFGNSLTMVFLPPGVSVLSSVERGERRSCIDLCAYHGAFKHNGKNQFYAVVPDQECAGIKNALDCKKDLPLVDATTVAVSYAYVAAMTNPADVFFQGRAPAEGWADRYGTDIGMPCTGSSDRITGPTGVTWTVQQIFSEKHRTCFTEPGRPYLIGK